MEETHKGDGIMANELACLNCGKGFTPTCHITRQKFCSSECRVRYNNAKRYYTDTSVNECPECGTPIEQSGEAGRWRRFCGKHCRQLYHYKKWQEKREANYQPPVQICPNCGKDFQPEWGPGTQRRLPYPVVDRLPESKSIPGGKAPVVRMLRAGAARGSEKVLQPCLLSQSHGRNTPSADMRVVRRRIFGLCRGRSSVLLPELCQCRKDCAKEFSQRHPQDPEYRTGKLG